MDAIVRLHKAGYVLYLKDDGVILPGLKWSVYTKEASQNNFPILSYLRSRMLLFCRDHQSDLMVRDLLAVRLNLGILGAGYRNSILDLSCCGLD